MDAKPQRPLRVLRVNDENAIPVNAAGKTLHQRNKSTPALPSLMQIGALKAAGAKRTVFADVSNTARQISSKDDLVLPGKSKSFFAKDSILKPIQEIIVKPAQLQKPAQRPQQSLTSKSLASRVFAPKDTSAPAAPVAPSRDFHVDLDRKLSTKRSTAVLKEVEPVAKESVNPLPIEPISVLPLPSLAEEDNVSANVSANVNPSISIGDVLDDSTVAFPAEDNWLANMVARPISELPPDLLEEFADILPNSVVPEPAAVQMPEPEFHQPIEQYAAPSVQNIEYIPVKARVVDVPESTTALNLVAGESAKVNVATVDPRDYVDALEHQAKALEEERFHEVARSIKVPTLPEEEEWDEEDDEYYDADGYTTSRSFRSRGDNTTGGMTTVLAPKFTAKTERELAAARVFVDSMATPEDVEDEEWDTSMVAEYSEEIFGYMRELEEKWKPDPHYMTIQAEIQWSMRSVLMDWLVQVHQRFTLLPETLFLAVNYVDRFLSKKPVSLAKLQLVGATAIFVAAKYEEINCPSVNEIVYMVDNGYTVDEILKAERFMLNMLQFDCGWPGPMSFLRRVSKADDYDLETRTLAKYFLEVTIMDERFVACVPSFTAAGAHCLARLMLRKGDWSLAHVHYSQYTYAQLRNLIATVLECCQNPQKHHQAVFDKYADRRFKRASLFVEQEIHKGFELPPIRRQSTFKPI